MEFNELTETAQAAAIANICAKMANEWFEAEDRQRISDCMVYAFAETLGSPYVDKCGEADFPGIVNVELRGWSVNHGGSASFDGTLTPDNAPSLPWVDGLDHVKLDSANGGTEIAAGSHWSNDADVTREEIDAMENAVRDAVNAAVSAGIAEFEYTTGEDNARDYAETNPFMTFDEDGELIDE